jgi:hypothetical protein
VRVLVTGSRYWTDAVAIKERLVEVQGDRSSRSMTLVHGAAPGADTIAAGIADRLGWTVESFPAEWERFGKAAGRIRNQLMVDHGADICLVFPLPQSRGTWDGPRRAKRAGIPRDICMKYIE